MSGSLVCSKCGGGPVVSFDATDTAYCQLCLDAPLVPCRARCEESGGCDWDNPREGCPQTEPERWRRATSTPTGGAT